MNRVLNKIKQLVRKTNFLQPLYHKLHKVKKDQIINDTVAYLNKLENKKENEIFDVQKNCLIKTLNEAKTNVPYYKTILEELDFTDLKNLKKIPFLTKQLIKENKNSLINVNFEIGELAIKNTGGSTGQPLEFYCTTKAGLQDAGFHFHHYSKMGYIKGDRILGAGAVIINEEERKNNIYWKKIGMEEPFGDYKLSILYLTQDNVSHYVNKFLSYKPSILRGYPSLFDSLAQHIIEHNIVFNFKVKGISLTSEKCSETQKNNIEKAFKSQVYFEYGHNEISVLCHSEDHTYLYKSAPTYGYVEVLNDDGSETEIGEIGNIVVTGFLNNAMPLIRYRTEDLGRLAYKNGGTVHFSEIIGRSQDFIFSNDQRKISISAITSWQHFDAFARISKWQIVQKVKGEIDIFIIKGNGYTQADEIEIDSKIKKIIDLEIKYNYVNHIERTKGGKHLFLIQNIKH